MTTKSKRPPPTPPELPEDRELARARKEFEEACVATDVASKKHDAAVTTLKRTISDPQFRAVRAPTASQVELELPPEKR